MPKVSVIVPNYNHARFLEQRLESIFNQTYQDFEIILLDDASTDHSLDVFEQFSDHPQVRCIFNTINSGSPFKQWNKGIKEAHGEYVWIAESDDFAELNFLEVLVPLLENNPQLGLAYCQSQIVDENNAPIKTMHCWTDDLDIQRWRSDYINDGINECKNYLVIKNTIPNASAVLIRKKTIEEAGYADTSLRLCGDWITWIKILMISDIAFNAKVLNNYRYLSSSVRSRTKSNGQDLYEAIQVFLYLKSNLKIQDSISDKVGSKFIYDWFRLLLSSNTRITLGRNFEFYKLTKAFDPIVELRMLNHFRARYLA